MTSQSKVPDPVCVGMLTSDPLRLDGLRELLERDGRYRIIPLATVGDENPGPQLAVVDVTSMVHLESLVRQLRRARPQMAVLVLGPEIDFQQIMSIIGFGAKGYLSYSASEQELRMALQVMEEGSIWAPRKVLAQLLAGKGDAVQAKLTRREEQVLRLLVQGRPNRQIAEALGLDETTVKAHLGRVMRKLGVRNRIALSLKAYDRLAGDRIEE